MRTSLVPHHLDVGSPKRPHLKFFPRSGIIAAGGNQGVGSFLGHGRRREDRHRRRTSDRLIRDDRCRLRNGFRRFRRSRFFHKTPLSQPVNLRAFETGTT